MSIFADDLWLVSTMPFNDNYPHSLLNLFLISTLMFTSNTAKQVKLMEIQRRWVMIKSSPEVNNLTFHNFSTQNFIRFQFPSSIPCYMYAFHFQIKLYFCFSLLMCCLYKCQIQLLESHFKSAHKQKTLHGILFGKREKFVCHEMSSEWAKGWENRTPIVLILDSCFFLCVLSCSLTSCLFFINRVE